MALALNSTLYGSEQISNTTKLLRWCVLWMVCMAGVAYEQVELPQGLYTYTTYFLSLLYLALAVRRPSPYCAYLALPFCYFVVNLVWSVAFHVSDTKLNFLLLIILCELLLLDSKSKIWVYKGFRIFIVAMSVAGIIGYLSFILGLGLPYAVRDYYGSQPALYINYHFAYIVCNLDYAFPRLCGLFNEPGYLGTIAALILIIERLNLRKVGNFLIFVASLFTFSLAYWVLLILYLVISRIRKLIYAFAIIGVLATAFMIIQNVEIEDPATANLIERFQFEDGKLKGDNRVSDQFDIYFDKMQRDGSSLFGKGPDAMNEYNITASAGLKVYLLKYGYLGFAILWGFAFFMALRYARGNRGCWILIFLFFINTYQRAHFYSPDYFCILFCGMDYILLRAGKQKHAHNHATIMKRL